MAFIFSIKAKIKAKTIFIGKTIDVLCLLVAIYNFVIERIVAEKNISRNEAEIFVDDCLKDGIKTIL